MSVRRVLGRGLDLGRSVLQLGLAKSIGRVTAKLRTDRLRAGPWLGSVQPRAFLPARYRYYRMSVRGAAAQLQAAAFRRGFGGGPRNRAVLLAFGLGVGLIEQQLEEDRSSSRTCQEIQAVFRQKKFQTPLKPFRHGYRLDDYVVGRQIGKGSNAAVYEAAAGFNSPGDEEKAPPSVREEEEEEEETRLPACCSLRSFPLALKMMWNFGAGSSDESILKSMSQELVPAAPSALQQELLPIGRFGVLPKRLEVHPNVIRVYRAFTADVPLLPGAQEEYPDLLPTRLNPDGLGHDRTLFLVMKNYPCTLRQYLQRSRPGPRQATLMVLQLLEGVDHLCQQGVAHRDIKSDNVLLELDSAGCPRLVISDFGCSLSRGDRSLLLPFTSAWVDRGGNASLMAPEVATAAPGSGVVIDYSKADAWAVGAVSYEIFGQTNPFYRPVGLESRRYREEQLPALPLTATADVQLVIGLLLRRNPCQRPSARVAADMLHLSLWGRPLLASHGGVAVKKLVDWLLCQSAVVLLKGCRGPAGTRVEAELQRCFLSSLEMENLRTAVGFLLHGQHQRQARLLPA